MGLRITDRIDARARAQRTRALEATARQWCLDRGDHLAARCQELVHRAEGLRANVDHSQLSEEVARCVDAIEEATPGALARAHGAIDIERALALL